MSDLTLTITLTDAGMAAVAAAHGQGLQAKITHVAVGDQGYAPGAAATGLRNELARVALTAGGVIAPCQILLQGMIPSDGHDFFIRELGYFLEDGTLLGVWSDPTSPLGWVGGATPWFFKLTFAWSALPADAITVIIADDAGQAGMALDLAQLDAKVRHTVEVGGGLVWDDVNVTQLTAAIQAMIAAGIAAINPKQRSVIVSGAAIAAGVVDGNPVRWDAAAGQWSLAKADGSTNDLGLGIADVTNSEVTLFGETRPGLLTGLVPGVRYFLTAGGGIGPAAAADKVSVGIAKSATVLWVDFDAVGAGDLPVAALPYPTVLTADYRVGAVGAAVAGQGGAVSIPAGVTIVMARNTSGSVGRQVTATTAAWTSGALLVNSTYYLRAVINAAGALAPYVQRGADDDPIPAGLYGAVDAAAGGGFDTTQVDILLAKVVTGAAGTTPSVTNLANASRLMGHYESTGPATNYNPISIAYTFAAAFTLNWARAPIIASEFGWVFGCDSTMHAGLMRYTRSVSRYQVTLSYLCDWIGTPGQFTNVTCGATIDVAA